MCLPKFSRGLTAVYLRIEEHTHKNRKEEVPSMERVKIHFAPKEMSVVLESRESRTPRTLGKVNV
jgi:hypothetical protein